MVHPTCCINPTLHFEQLLGGSPITMNILILSGGSSWHLPLFFQSAPLVILLPFRVLFLIPSLARTGTERQYPVISRFSLSLPVYPFPWVRHHEFSPALSAYLVRHFKYILSRQSIVCWVQHHYTTPGNIRSSGFGQLFCIIVASFCIYAGPVFNHSCVVLLQCCIQLTEL